MSQYEEQLRATVKLTPAGGVQVSRALSTNLAGYLDLLVPQGKQWSLYVTMFLPGSSQPMDLSSGYTAALTARPAPAATAVISLTSSAGITLSNGSGGGNITISVLGSATAAYSFVQAGYDLTVTLTSGTVVTPVLTGLVQLEKSVLA